MALAAFPARASGHACTRVRRAPFGGDGTFYFAVTQYADTRAGDVADGFYLYPSTAGCYTIQVDGSDFQEIIVIQAT